MAGFTVKDVAKRCRVSADKVRRWIRTGQLKAFYTADEGQKPRYVVSPHDLEMFKDSRNGARPTPPVEEQRRPRQSTAVDYYPAD